MTLDENKDTCHVEDCLEVLQDFLRVLADVVGQGKLQNGREAGEALPQDGHLLMVLDGCAGNTVVNTPHHVEQLEVVRRVGEVPEALGRVRLQRCCRLDRRRCRSRSDFRV